MTAYKLSVVVPGRRDLGRVQNLDQEPKLGDHVWLDQEQYKIVELVQLIPPGNGTAYLHATCRPAKDEQPGGVS